MIYVIIGTHISRLAGINDKKINPEADAERLENAEFPLIDSTLEEKTSRRDRIGRIIDHHSRQLRD